MALNLRKACDNLQLLWDRMCYIVEYKGDKMTKADKLRELVNSFQLPVPKDMGKLQWEKVVASALHGVDAMEQMSLKNITTSRRGGVIRLYGIKGNVVTSMSFVEKVRVIHAG